MKLKFKAILGTFAVIGGMFASIIGASANPLHESVQRKDIEGIKTQVSKNPQWLFEVDRFGRLPIGYATENGLEYVRALVDEGAKALLANGEKKDVMSDESDADILAELRKKIVCAPTARGFTALHYANKVEMVKYLVEQGADVNARNDCGNTPIFTCGEPKSLLYLIKNGAETNLRNNIGGTPLHTLFEMLAWHDNIELWSRYIPAIDMLARRPEANVNATDNHGQTPLDYFDKHRSQYLRIMRVGADGKIETTDPDDHTVRDNPWEQVRRILQNKFGAKTSRELVQ